MNLEPKDNISKFLSLNRNYPVLHSAYAENDFLYGTDGRVAIKVNAETYGKKGKVNTESLKNIKVKTNNLVEPSEVDEFYPSNALKGFFEKDKPIFSTTLCAKYLKKIADYFSKHSDKYGSESKLVSVDIFGDDSVRFSSNIDEKNTEVILKIMDNNRKEKSLHDQLVELAEKVIKNNTEENVDELAKTVSKIKNA
tara:strand:+ start:65826 stop:66413 length:588 start_codon:yes stop_codon:yes gene_type:complete